MPGNPKPRKKKRSRRKRKPVTRVLHLPTDTPEQREFVEIMEAKKRGDQATVDRLLWGKGRV